MENGNGWKNFININTTTLRQLGNMKAILGHFLVLCLLHAVLRPYINLTQLVQRAVARYFFPAPADGSSYDFVVVGAGAAGCTVAGRLAQQGKYSVLLLEAGGPSHWMMGVPFFMPAFLVCSWHIDTVQQGNLQQQDQGQPALLCRHLPTTGITWSNRRATPWPASRTGVPSGTRERCWAAARC